LAIPASASAHVQAVISYLTSQGVTTYRGEAPRTATAPYVVLHAAPAIVGTSNLIDAADLRVDFQTTCVGGTSEQAEWLSDKVVVSLWRATPAVAGRSVRPIYSEQPPQSVRRDDALAEPLFYATSRWTIRSSA